MSPLLTGVLASQISGHLNTFTLTGAYDALATVTVPIGGASSITFSAIPQTGYSHLEIRFIARTNRASLSDVLLINPNGNSSTNGHFLYGTGSSVIAGTGTGYLGWATGSSATSGIFAAGIATILDYASPNKNIVVRSLAGWDGNGTGGELALFSDLQTASGLTSLTIASQNSATFQQFSQFSLFGIK